MELSIKEAAVLLGRSPRTVRHLAQSGKIPARREGRAWRIDRDALTANVSDDAERRIAQLHNLESNLRAAVAQVTPKSPSEKKGRVYSIGDLRAFMVGRDVYASLERHADRFEAARADLRRCMRALSDGFHQFHPELKIERFVEARTAAANAIAELMLDEPAGGDVDALHWALRLEDELLGHLRGLIRRAERRRELMRWGRSTGLHAKLRPSRAISSSEPSVILGINASSSARASRPPRSTS